ncbi:MAG: hypothetical protein KDI30_04835, partial [Pseudomonadales bacterium]|nr:hypothetical protein [Pseudomonadales bacterium]
MMKKLATWVVCLAGLVLGLCVSNTNAASWSGTNNPGEYKEYNFVVSGGDTDLSLIVPDVNGVSSQIILKQGSAPVDNNDYDYISSAGTNEQILTLSAPSLVADTWYVRVVTASGASGPHSFTLYQDVNEAATPTALALKTAHANVDLDINQWDYYRIVTPAVSQGLRIVMSTEDQGATGCAAACPKADVYLRQGSPTGADVSSVLNGSLSTLTLDTASMPTDTPLYIAVKADASLRYNLYVDDKFMRYLTWDDGSTLAGSSNKTQPDLQGGSYFFRITSQSVATNAWRTALKVTGGEAAVFLNKDNIPFSSATYSSANTGSDGFVLDETKFADGQTWYIRVDAQPGSTWSLLSGAVYVNDLGNLAAYNSSASSATNIEVGPEGMSFFKTQIGVGTKAWRLHLAGDTYPMYVDKNEVPLPSAVSQYDKAELTTGQMLLVPTYLTSGTYYMGVVANPGTVFSFDSRQQEIRTP